MKKNLLLIAALLFSSTLFAQETSITKKMPTRFQSVSLDKAELHQEGDKKFYCPKCGMTLNMFYKTNHLAQVEGKTQQYCSLHCLTNVLQTQNEVSKLKVVDTSSLKFIDVNSSWYVVGSSKAGTMSSISKYAFAKKEDAQAFSKEFGGTISNFEETIESVKKLLSSDQAIVQKKQSAMAQKGEMLYAKICSPIEEKFTSIMDAKAHLKTQQPCGNIRGKKLQAIAIYLSKR